MVWGIPRGFREGVLEEVEVGEDGKDEAPAAARRTLAMRRGSKRTGCAEERSQTLASPARTEVEVDLNGHFSQP
jgi:hypothetical protein